MARWQSLIVPRTVPPRAYWYRCSLISIGSVVLHRQYRVAVIHYVIITRTQHLLWLVVIIYLRRMGVKLLPRKRPTSTYILKWVAQARLSRS